MDEQTGPVIDRSIYGIPMFANFTVKNLAAAELLYNAIGFITLATVTGMDGNVQLVHLRRMKYQDILVAASTLGGRGTPIPFAAGDEEFDKLAERAKELPGAKVAGPVDTPWFTSDVTIDDPDGNRIIFTARRVAEQADSMKWARQNISGDFEVPMPSPDSAQ